LAGIGAGIPLPRRKSIFPPITEITNPAQIVVVERASIYRSLNLPLESMSRNVSFGWNKARKIWLSYIGPGENLDGRPLQVLGSLGGGFYIYDELSYL